jgi:hypothetical protein
MRLIVSCALVMGVWIFLLVGFLVMAQELFSESAFAVPHEPGEEAGCGYMDESPAHAGSPNNDNN